MGPYCKFCNTRCFIPTTESDYVKRDLKATCKEGIIFDLNKSLTPIISVNGNKIGWMLDFNRHGEYSTALQLLNHNTVEFELRTSDIISENIDLIDSNHSFTVK